MIMLEEEGPWPVEADCLGIRLRMDDGFVQAYLQVTDVTEIRNETGASPTTCFRQDEDGKSLLAPVADLWWVKRIGLAAFNTPPVLLTDSVRARLRQARRIVVFTGAGMSAESGLSTFRDERQGLWARYKPEDVATPLAFGTRPQIVWNWYRQRIDKARRAFPNDGHRAIARLAGHAQVTVVTQNVDGLHQRAGSQDVLELHGNLFALRPFIDEEKAFADGREPVICPVCDGYADPDGIDPYAAREDLQNITLRAGAVPQCPGCGAMLRPGVVWFGESLDPVVLAKAIAAVEECDALICIGSSLQVQPAAGLPSLAAEHGAVVVEINSEPALAGAADAVIAGTAATNLPVLLREVWGGE
jgi:NAD-dependent deacetylase